MTRAEQRGAQSSLGNQVQDATFVFMPVLLGGLAAAHTNSAALLATAALMLLSNLAFALLVQPRGKW